MMTKASMWKFPLEVRDRVVVMMPIGARILCANVQRDVACLWALVDPDAGREPRAFRIIGTGHEHPSGTFGRYVGTFFMADGSLVFHVFEEED